MNKWCIVFVICLNILNLGNALECYVCRNQENNVGKCSRTAKICDQGQDTCLTEIRWGSPPYWSQGSIKQFYISKKCSTRAECERTRENSMSDCSHIWYQDWACTECCQGDRCNYYIISGAVKANLSSTVFSLLATFIVLFVVGIKF